MTNRISHNHLDILKRLTNILNIKIEKIAQHCSTLSLKIKEHIK